MYQITIPSLKESYINPSLKIGLLRALLLLNRSNKKIHVIRSIKEREIPAIILKDGRVVLFTNFNQEIVVEHIQGGEKKHVCANLQELFERHPGRIDDQEVIISLEMGHQVVH